MAEVGLQQIGVYSVTGLLRATSTSNIYTGKQRKKEILIKRLTVPLVAPEDKKAFLTRAKQLKKLQNRTIVNIIDANFDGDYGYLVMDAVPGIEMSRRFKTGDQIAADEAKRYLSPIADALHYAHMNNVVHGNLQPANLFVDERNGVLLTEFSLTPVDATFKLDDEQGAIAYMAPEQLQGRPGPAADQYALAVIIYELLCGQRPYLGIEREQILQKQLQDEPPPVRSFNQSISAAVEHVLMQALARNPEERFAHTQAFAKAYLNALLGLPIQNPETTHAVPTTSNGNGKVIQKPVPASSPQLVQKESEEQPGQDQQDKVGIVPSPAQDNKGKQSIGTGRISSRKRPSLNNENIQSGVVESRQDREQEDEVRPLLGEREGEQEQAEPVEPVEGEEQLESVPTISTSRLQRMVTDDLCQGGVLSGSLPGYEERAAQVEMATIVSQAINQRVPAIIEAATGTGKALDVETPIPTPGGWKRMGNLVVGDIVFDEQGKPTHVTAAFDIMLDRPCYEVTFSDGSTLIADAEHEWASYTYIDRQFLANVSCENVARQLQGFVATRAFGAERARQWQGFVATRAMTYVLVTTEMMAATLTAGSNGQANHAIAVAGPLVLPDADLPIGPYVLGVWLAKSNSRSKHIPKLYLRASERQRRALLAGLLDTDGTVSHHGAIEFTSTSSQLADDVYELTCSLGFRPSIRQEVARLNGKNCGPKWTLAFTTSQRVFRLERKIVAHQERLSNYSPERNHFRYVVDVRKVPSRPVRCIQVDAPSHLYLAGRSMIPTHNSLAYLVPVVRSGQVAIVSTANKALQEQLYYKDIPFVQKHIKYFEAALVKGVNNYICLDRVDKERIGMQAFAKNRDFQRLYDFMNEPETGIGFTGDFETLDFHLPSDIRSRIATDNDQCAWKKCDFFEDCYVHQMRERAASAQVIVVNHTLLLLDAAMGGFLLPERDVIILDEAHHLEEEATRSFTITVHPGQIQTLLAQRMLKDHSNLSLQDKAMQAAQTLWFHVERIAEAAVKGRVNLETPVEEGLQLATAVADIAVSMEAQRPKDLSDKDDQLYEKLVKRAQNLAEGIRTVFAVADANKFVYYVERVEGSAARGFVFQVSAAPLDVTAWLKERLFDKTNVISTSATLATIGPNPTKPQEKGPNFNYFRRRIGLDPLERSDVLERVLPLTFDYESNALLYLPRDLPAPAYGPGSDDYMISIAREMYRLVKLSRGRAFLLFSSRRMLDRAYELMSPHLPYPLLKQGDMTRLELTKRFREEEGAVLFGLKSFWEGVDIAGEALSLVVIDKLPFDPPDDPVHEARVAMMKAAGENWFGTYVLPQAVLRLKQGIGRLLRTREDRGVMAILDTRLHTKGYGKMVIDAMPPARRTSNIRDVERFFAG